MKKALIRVVKRCQEVVAGEVATSPVSDIIAKAKDSSKRRMSVAVGVWISEYRENRRAEESSAKSKIAAWKNNSKILLSSNLILANKGG